MKKTLPLLIFLLPVLLGRASDTLTIRQVFAFEVGDTLDYLTWSEMTGPVHNQWEGVTRYVIAGKFFSPDSQTVTYHRWQLSGSGIVADTLVYPHLDSSILYYDTVRGALDQFQIRPDSLLHITNTTHWATTDGGYTHTYTAGLGKTYDWSGYGNPIDGGGDNETSLIYYARGGVAHGTPYYLAHGEQYIHYTPLPEACAVWNMKSGPIDEQIRTGNSIMQGGHKYIEMLYRSYDGSFTPDSLLGYFYNDSSRRSVFFAQSLSSSPIELYDFHSSYSSMSCTGMYHISPYTVRGRSLSRWTAAGCEAAYGSYCFFDYIEGIGGSAGLVNVKQLGGRFRSVLTSLCVCGDVIYSNGSDTSCALLTGIAPIIEDQFVQVYPTPATDAIQISIPQISYPAKFILSDLLGRESYSAVIEQQMSTHDISTLPVGFYLWALEDNNGTIIQTGKIVKQ